MDYKDFFAKLWTDYVQITPSAEKIHELLLKEEKQIINDHIALRTFNTPELNLEKLAEHFKKLGYKEAGQYEFVEKKLEAKHFQHPDPEAPKVFISHLLLEKCSDNLNKIISNLLTGIDKDIASKDDFIYMGSPWQVSYSDYQQLLDESEYAAWMAAWGYHPNHFTVSVNHLENSHSLQELNQKLKDAGYKLNQSGGEIKGSKEVLLEQSSTMADKVELNFTDKTELIPSCFYEFALRHPMQDGNLYQGFVAANADKIFESTNVKS